MQSLPDFPAPQAAAPSPAQSPRQAVVAATVSAVAHGGVIGLVLAGQAWFFAPRLAPPERGVTSIVLVASAAAESEPAEFVALVPANDAVAESIEAACTPISCRRQPAEPAKPMQPRVQAPPAAFAGEIIERATPDLPSTRAPRSAERRSDTDTTGKVAANFQPNRNQSMPAAGVATSRVIADEQTDASRRHSGAKVDVLPSKRYSPQPTYPPEALARRLTGVAKVRAEVGADGRVTGVSLYRSSGYRSLDRAALDAVRRWRFDPAQRDGRAVAHEIVVPLRFTIVE